MKSTVIGLFIAAVLFFGKCGTVSAVATIDFEITPGGLAPVDDAILNTAYNIGGTLVSFGNDKTGNNQIDAYARFEDYFVTGSGETGVSPTAAEALHAFTDDSNPYHADPDLTASGLGQTDGQGKKFLIREQRTGDAGGAVGAPNFLSHPFLVVFDGILPISVSGQIWDIDAADGGPLPRNAEQYRVQALDAGGNVLAFLDSPVGLGYSNVNSLSGLPWNFSFDLAVDIKTVRIIPGPGWVGDDERGFGFDNFTIVTQGGGGGPDPLPEPVTATLGLMSLAGLAIAIHRRRA
ncbi:MAG: hypothetical protein K8S99_03700 [Planctomycetes bacterium]|nr:hypothetical protein [Planctomycetota bacterium]